MSVVFSLLLFLAGRPLTMFASVMRVFPSPAR